MSAAQLAKDQTRNLKTSRKPLQPTNPLSNPQTKTQILKKAIDLHRPIDDPNKENPHRRIPTNDPTMIDASLAEELRAMRERKERLKVEREKTEGVMRERGLVMDRKMEEMREKGEEQRRLEIQVDRLFRLKEIKSLSKRNSTIRSLRDKEHGGKIREVQSQGINSEITSECRSLSQLQSSSSEIHTEN